MTLDQIEIQLICNEVASQIPRTITPDGLSRCLDTVERHFNMRLANYHKKLKKAQYIDCLVDGLIAFSSGNFHIYNKWLTSIKLIEEQAEHDDLIDDCDSAYYCFSNPLD